MKDGKVSIIGNNMGNTHIVTAEARTTGILKCRGIGRTTTTTTTKRRCRCVCSSRRRRPRNYWHDRNPEECLRAPSVRSQTPACNLTNDNTVLLSRDVKREPENRKKNRREATSNRLIASAERPVTIILLTIGLSVTGKKPVTGSEK